MTSNTRVKEIDFLRGVAVLLVVLFHYPYIPYLSKIGYVGVDLFFVLSGFLISGLLFKEYVQFGNVKPAHFLIRRGFKIYPLFYFFITLSIVSRIIFHDKTTPLEIFGELTFTRNFTGGFWAHTWTLSVEEHFYFFIAIAMLFLKPKLLYNVKKMNRRFIAVFIFCWLIELLNALIEHRTGENYFFNAWARYVQTQYCFDSLLYGVFICYNFMFNREQLERLFKKYAAALIIISFIVITLAPLTRNNYFSAFKSMLLYFSFGNILLLFITGMASFSKVKSVIAKKILAAFSTTGVYSYAIYLFHPYVRDYIIGQNSYLRDYRYAFFIYAALSIICGITFTKLIEFPMLALREKYFPARKKELQLAAGD